MMQRRKGKAGEQELARLLRNNLSIDVTRNLIQARDGGADLVGLPGFALEVKRSKQARLGAWWLQTCQQARAANALPALAYRLDFQEWHFVLPLTALGLAEPGPNHWQLRLDVDLCSFLAIIGPLLAAAAEKRSIQSPIDIGATTCIM